MGSGCHETDLLQPVLLYGYQQLLREEEGEEKQQADGGGVDGGKTDALGTNLPVQGPYGGKDKEFGFPVFVRDVSIAGVIVLFAGRGKSIFRMIGFAGCVRGSGGKMGAVVFQSLLFGDSALFVPFPLVEQEGNSVVGDRYGKGVIRFHLGKPGVGNQSLPFEIGNQSADIPLERKEVALFQPLFGYI